MDENKKLSDAVEENVNEAAIAASQQIDYLVKQLSADLDKLQMQIKEQRQMVKDSLESDSRHQLISDKIKDLAKQKQAIQKELEKNTGVQSAKEELKSLNEQRKTIQHKLSDYLRQYVETFNSKTLEDLEGNLKEIITQYKLIKQSKK